MESQVDVIWRYRILNRLNQTFMCILVVHILGPPAHAMDATVPGAVNTPYPTLHHLAVVWEIQGDDDLDSVVTVRYRPVGEQRWRQGMPLRRIPSQTWCEEQKGASRTTEFSWTNKHSGSLFDLEPDTQYELALSLADPDGGSTERTIQARTRPVPQAMPGAPIKRTTPDNVREVAAQAQPGDILLLGPGNYGYFEVSCDCEPERPIVFRADPKGVFPDSTRSGTRPPRRGKPLFEGVSLQNRKHVYLEGLVSYGTIDLFNAESCAVKRCQVNTVFGIISGYSENLRKWVPKVASRLTNPKAKPQPHALNCYIADNIVIGLTTWVPEALGASGANMGEGIEITGPGNVICYNRVVGFRDCISTLEGLHAVNQVCIDIYNNDVDIGPDDGIEADFCMGNCWIMCNRITNCGMGVSSQPGFGGPTYFIRNVMYNLTNAPYKFYRGSIGDVVLHNTVVKAGDGAACPASQAWSRAYFRNNLGIGGGSVRRFGRDEEGPVLAAYFPGADSMCDFDYNGYGITVGTLRGNIGSHWFDSLEELRKGPEPHAVQVGLDAFFAAVRLPDPPFPARTPPDLRLSKGSSAVDAAQVIPNINDDYTGTAPDIGAYERGCETPIYGPRNIE